MTSADQRLCDKCGQPVAPSNDAVLIDSLARGRGGFEVLLYCSRHFLPTTTCQGSPSRAQYIEGQPRDQRGYGYHADLEPIFRRAYEKAQTYDQV